MSNFLAIATVTATLSQLIQAAIDIDVPGSRVTTVRPDIAGSSPGEAKVNLFLYQVTTNAALRNADLPTRRAEGSLVQKPKLALDLHYLFTFYGDEVTLIPQRLMGSSMRTLHAVPMLSRTRIRNMINSGAFPYLATSTLADDVELVKFTPLPLSLEELSKLWSVMLQTNYALSVTYQGTVVLIESDEVPQPAQPAKEIGLALAPFNQPTIERLLSQAGVGQIPQANQPIVVGTTLILEGRQLQGGASTQTLVRIAGNELQPAAGAVSGTRITIQIPASVQAGLQSIQVIHKRQFPGSTEWHSGIESNVLPLILRPMITSISKAHVNPHGTLFSADVTLQINPQIGLGQRAVLLLNETSSAANPAAYAFSLPPLGSASNTVTFAISGIKAATYLVRVQVDGAENVEDADASKHSLTIP